MAGGVGSRFWPASTKQKPKQFLRLADTERSLLRATWERVTRVVDPTRVWVVTTESQRKLTREDLPEMDVAQILAEPVGRNTAPCIGWAASVIQARHGAAPVVFLPADHFIANEDAFAEMLLRGLQACEGGSLVTVGIDPKKPETGFGYIEVGTELGTGESETKKSLSGVCSVRRFVEKPDLETAREFLRAGNFLWNSGMFFFRADAILAAIAKHLPALAEGLSEIRDESMAGRARAVLEAVYPKLPAISIDHGIMEKVQQHERSGNEVRSVTKGGEGLSSAPGARVLVIRDNRRLGWSDLGSWNAVWELADKDRSGNALPPGCIPVNAKDCYVLGSSTKPIALVGVEGLVVVDTPEALLVLQKERAQEVRQVVDALALTETPESLSSSLSTKLPRDESAQQKSKETRC